MNRTRLRVIFFAALVLSLICYGIVAYYYFWEHGPGSWGLYFMLGLGFSGLAIEVKGRMRRRK